MCCIYSALVSDGGADTALYDLYPHLTVDRPITIVATNPFLYLAADMIPDSLFTKEICIGLLYLILGKCLQYKRLRVVLSSYQRFLTPANRVGWFSVVSVNSPVLDSAHQWLVWWSLGPIAINLIWIRLTLKLLNYLELKHTN